MGIKTDNGLAQSRAVFDSFDAAYRVCFMAAIFVVTLILPKFLHGLPPEFYFSVPILGSMVLIFVTFPLGNNQLGADLRGLLGWAFFIELFYAVISSFDALLPLYRLIRVAYNYIDYGLLCGMVGRCFWMVRGANGMLLSYPKFDFVRGIVGSGSSHKLLTTRQKVYGYVALFSSFVVGCFLQYTKTEFALPAAGAMFLVFVVYVLTTLRNSEVAFRDLMDSD